MKKLLMIILLLIITSFSVIAIQPTQQYNKIFLSPFYRENLVLNTNYTYNLIVDPPDGVSNVKSAIISFNAQINGQTQNFTLWVNGQRCNNPNYYIATAFSTTGTSQIYFDCSNVIINKGNYTIILRSVVNTGTVQGWVDLTYMNNPQGSTDIFGTEYTEGDDATIFLLLKDSYGVPISNGTCVIDIYYPNIANQTHPEWINNGLMMYKEEGLYYYDFTVPLLEGLYMVNAQCAYITDNNYFYTLVSGKSPIRNVTTGTYTGDTFVLNDYQEWLYTQCDSGTAGGGGKACDSSLQWNISSSTLGNVTALYSVFLGENSGSGTMTTYWWNWTNSAWVTLPNTLTFKATASGGVPSGIDEYLSNQVPLTAIGTGVNSGLVRIRYNTVAGSTFKQFNNWAALKTSAVTTSIQELKGSGEVHVSSAPPGVNRFFKVISCDGFIDGRCGEFTNDGEYDLLEGEIDDYFNITATSSKNDVQISYTSPFAVDCTALYNVYEYNGTGWEEFVDYTLYSQPAYENCIISLEKDIESGTDYQFWVRFDNYMKWEVDWTKHIADDVNASVAPLCANRNFTYINPITETSIMPNDSITNFCYQFYDDQYFLNTFYDDSQTITVAGEYASYVQEMRFYRGIMIDRFTFLVLGNNTNLMSDYYANKVWNNPTRTLTSYPNITAAINTTQVAQDIWNYTTRDLTYYNMTDTTNYTRIDETIYAVNQSLYNYITNIWLNTTAEILLIPSNTWTYVNRNLTYYQDVMNYTQGALYVWNNTIRNLTYYPAQVDLTNYNAIYQGVWNYTLRNLTYFPTQTDMTNYGLIATLVWNNTDRNLTYYPAQVDLTNYTQINEGVWSYTIRNLTYFPTQQDLTNYGAIYQGVWNNTDRNLTYYPAIDYISISDYVWNYTTGRYVNGIIN